MAVIHILDKHTAELIAAGEVVERPASVVKELAENAIDAGAHQITVSIERGGIALIEVSDDGSGIEAEYLPAAFIRHATSKIERGEDLARIATLGFRGEALASIASVARVELLTCTPQDEFASRYRIEGGQELGLEPGARGVGTTISVRELFYNTPARMKFLKKDSSEGAFVAETVQRLALSHPEISFRFMRDGRLQFKTPGDGTLRNAVYAVLGREFAKDLLEVDYTDPPHAVWGLVTPPRGCRASRGMQYFYVNGRFVKNRTMMAALENAYKGTVMQGRFPGCVLFLKLVPELVDVNVHPAKTEVRFAREREVFEAVYRAVRQALAAPGSGEKLFSFTKDAPDAEKKNFEKQNTFTDNTPQKSAGQPALPGEQAELRAPLPHGPLRAGEQPMPAKDAGAGQGARQAGFAAEPLPVRRTNLLGGQVTLHSAPLSWDAPPAASPAPAVKSETVLDLAVEELPGLAAPEKARSQPRQNEELPAPAMPAKDGPQPPQKTDEPAQQTAFLPEPEQPPLVYIGEAFKTYIITQWGDSLCLIDKHAAHERILYEKLAAGYGRVSSQLLLEPVPVTLSAEEKQAVLQYSGLLRDAGVEAEDFGGCTVLVRAVPADVLPKDLESLLVELASKLARGAVDALSEKTEWVLHSIACRAAVKAGDHSRPEELLRLAQDILAGRVPPFCPHGRPVVLKLTKKELEKQFGRMG